MIYMITRRGFLGLMGVVAATALGVGCSSPSKPSTVEHQTIPDVPWKYEKLDPDYVADLAYDSYMHHHCMFGVVNSVVKALAEKVGYPYTVFPTKMAVYGKGGVVGWATLCGALNGAAMVCYMVLPEKQADVVINDLYSWYQYTPLPEYKPKKPVKSDLSPFPKSKSESPLCHVSVSRWCKESGYKAFSPERAERCGRLTADVAKKLVEILNSVKDGIYQPQYSLDNVTMKCRGCHCKGSSLEDSRGKMACYACHTDSGAKHIEDISGHPFKP